MFVIGIDVHVRNSFFHINHADGRTFKKGRVANTLADFAQFLAPIEGHAAKAVMESTTNSRPVYLLLKEWARQAKCDLEARVLHARKLRMIAQSEAKCDKIDGSELAHLADCNLRLSVSYMPPQDVFELRELTRTREDLVDARTMLKCQAHAILHRRGILLPSEIDLFSQAGRAWVKDVKSMDQTGRMALDRLYALISVFDARIKEADAGLKEKSKSVRWKADFDLLTTMPGVGLVTALTVLGEIGELSRFKSRAAISNFAGLIPVERSSNDKDWKGKVKRQGPRHLRRVLVEAAWAAIAHSEKYKEIYQKLVAKNGRKLVAATAVARRMLEDMYTMLKTRSAFKDKPSTSDAG